MSVFNTEESNRISQQKDEEKFAILLEALKSNQSVLRQDPIIFRAFIQTFSGISSELIRAFVCSLEAFEIARVLITNIPAIRELAPEERNNLLNSLRRNPEGDLFSPAFISQTLSIPQSDATTLSRILCSEEIAKLLLVHTLTASGVTTQACHELLGYFEPLVEAY